MNTMNTAHDSTETIAVQRREVTILTHARCSETAASETDRIAWRRDGAYVLEDAGFEDEADDVAADLVFSRISSHHIGVDKDTTEYWGDTPEPQHIWPSKSKGGWVVFSPTSDGPQRLAHFDLLRADLPVELAA